MKMILYMFSFHFKTEPIPCVVKQLSFRSSSPIQKRDYPSKYHTPVPGYERAYNKVRVTFPPVMGEYRENGLVNNHSSYRIWEDHWIDTIGFYDTEKYLYFSKNKKWVVKL